MIFAMGPALDERLFLIYVACWVGVIYVAFALPLATALKRGIAAARDPSYRVTPLPSVEVFRSVFQKGLWRILITLGLLVVVQPIGFFLSDLAAIFRPSDTLETKGILGVAVPLLCLGLALYTVSIMLFLAPRIRDAVKLSALSAALALGLCVACVEGFTSATRMDVWFWQFLAPTSIVNLLLALAAFWLVRRSVRRQGDRWFRFET